MLPFSNQTESEACVPHALAKHRGTWQQKKEAARADIAMVTMTCTISVKGKASDGKGCSSTVL